MADKRPDLFDDPIGWVGALGWQHVVLIVVAVAAFVALSFAPAATCSVHTSEPAPTVPK